APYVGCGRVERVARLQIRREGDRELTIRSLHLRGPETALEPRHAVDSHRTVRRRHGETRDGVRVAALVRAYADLHRVLLRAVPEGRDLVLTGHHQPERAADGRHANAKVGGARAIDSHSDLRVAVVHGDLRVGTPRRLLCLGEEFQPV